MFEHGFNGSKQKQTKKNPEERKKLMQMMMQQMMEHQAAEEDQYQEMMARVAVTHAIIIGLLGVWKMGEWSGVGHMGGMWIWWILGIVIIAALAWAVLGSQARNGGSGVSAEELLKRRYARGEINKEDYEKRLQDLRK